MDFSYWDLKDKFTLVEAALLWTEQSPDYIFGSLKVDGEAAKVFDVLVEAVEKKELVLNFANTVTREELTAWARITCTKRGLPFPRFLFYRVRKGMEEEQEDEAEEITSEEATQVAQHYYDRTAEDTRKRNEFAGVIKAMVVICPDRCKNSDGKITVEGVYEAIRKISRELWGVKKPILKESVAKSIIENLLKKSPKR